MSLKFDEALNIVTAKILEAPKPKYQTYSQDAAEISAKMAQEFFNINSIFKGTVSNWNETTEFYKTEVSKWHIPFLQVKMPLIVEPQRVFVFIRDDGEAVNLKTSVNHPAVENGYLNGEKLTQLFIWDLNRVLDRISMITCSSGKIYKLHSGVTKNTIGGLIIHVGATENDLEGVPSILYNFALSFVFTNNSYVYIYDSNFFRQSVESGILADLKKATKVRHNIKILLQCLVKQSSKISPIGLAMVLDSMEIGSEVGIGSLLLKGIPGCIHHLHNPRPLISAYRKLSQFKKSDSVQLSELEEVFGL